MSLYERHFPTDPSARLLARVWLPTSHKGGRAGPSPVLVADGQVFDLSPLGATVAQLVQHRAELDWSPTGLTCLGPAEEILDNTLGMRDPALPHFLAPVDLQAVKACGVTFAASLLERVIEEKAMGDPAAADAVRQVIRDTLGGQLTNLVPGSAAATTLKQQLIAMGAWSQYLEVGIGPWAEVFTKCQVLAAVGTGAEVGIDRVSAWNNPEPELVLIVDARGEIAGATLGNDVNLRDIEGRSALLLGKAKDNNASCALGPCIRLLDAGFGLDALRQAEITLEIEGPDGFQLTESCSMSTISRDITELVAQTINANRQFPDGLALFTGTLFAPTRDRGETGKGFTHHVGDRVRVSSPALGCLENRVNHCDAIPPWTFGLSEFMQNLANRGHLRTEDPAQNLL